MKKRVLAFLLSLLMCCMPVFPVGAEEYGSSEQLEEKTDYEELTVPDFEELGVERVSSEVDRYNVDACNGKIYVSGGGLQVQEEGKVYPVILVYDEEKETWGTIVAKFLSAEGELQTVIGEKTLYMFVNSGKELNIFSYDLEKKEVKKLASVEYGRFESERSLVYNNEYIWMIGGRCKETDKLTWTSGNEIWRFNIKSKKVESTEMKLNSARAGAFAEVTDGKIVVTGGEGTDGKWQNTTEVIDCEKESVTYTESETAVSRAFQKTADVNTGISGGTVSGEFIYMYETIQEGTHTGDVFRRVQVGLEK